MPTAATLAAQTARVYEEKAWSDRFMPAVKGICAQYLLTEAPVVEDRKRNSDLMTLTLAPVRLAVRVRRHSSLRWRDEVTIRRSRPMGTPTEFEKIVAGWGDQLFYGISDAAESGGLASWTLIELTAVRSLIGASLLAGGPLPGRTISTRVGDADFWAIPLTVLAEAGAIIATTEAIPASVGRAA